VINTLKVEKGIKEMTNLKKIKITITKKRELIKAKSRISQLMNKNMNISQRL
jgi:hypothetical protein